MNPQADFGTVLVVLGGLLQGSFAFPMKRMENKWRWENIWLIYAVVGLIFFPLLLAFATVPSLGTVYTTTPAAVLAMVALFGFGWGTGSTLFGLGISRVGMALTFAIVLGITSSLGSLLPLIILNPSELWTRRGVILLLGLVLVIAGIIFSSIAGSLRDREQRGAAVTVSRGGFKTGLLICIASGIFSPMLNFSFVFGRPVQEAAIAVGATADFASNAIWAPALAAGFLANGGYALYLLARNKTLSLYTQGGAPSWYWFGGAIMGLLWYGGISVYGMGAAAMGPLGGVIGWPVFMSTLIITANVLGVISGEWRGASWQARGFSWLGVAILVGAIVVISLGS